MNLKVATFFGCLCFAVFMANASSFQSQSDDEQRIRELVARHSAASQAGDFAGLVSGYRADSDVRYSDGVLLDGQPAIEQHYRNVLSRGPRAMAHTHPEDSIRIRFLREDVAFVDVDSLTDGGTDKDGVARKERRVPFFVVFTKVGGEWGVAIERMVRRCANG